MKFEPFNCPECNEPAEGTLDRVECKALFSEPDEYGHVEWGGESKMLWDTQQTDEIDGHPVLVCTNGHTWPARLLTES